jgi:Ca-activated chloride channel family protein
MNFSNPEAFFLLLVLALFIGIAARNYKKKKALLGDFLSPGAYKKLGVRSGGEIDFFKTSLVIFAMIFFILALAGPQWGEKFEPLEVKGIEMVFLLDTSNSMNAEDLKPNRLEVAKQLIISVVDNLQTDYVGLINFAGAAYVQCPLTIDYDAFKLMTEASVISPGEEQGTDFGEAFQLAVKTYEKSKSERRLLIMITDGEDQEKRWEDFIPVLKKQGIIVFSVGIGVTSGAPIPIRDKDGKLTGWKKDKKGNIVKTMLDENSLIRAASQTGGQYFRLTDAAAVDSFVANLKSFERQVLKQKVKLKKIKRFYIPLIIGIIILLLELILTERKIAWEKK